MERWSIYWNRALLLTLSISVYLFWGSVVSNQKYSVIFGNNISFHVIYTSWPSDTEFSMSLHFMCDVIMKQINRPDCYQKYLDTKGILWINMRLNMDEFV